MDLQVFIKMHTGGENPGDRVAQGFAQTPGGGSIPFGKGEG